MELKDLVGKHLLSGVDIIQETGRDIWHEEYEVVRFVLDSKTYKAIEDLSDGYRSYLANLEVTSEEITNVFSPQEVVGKMMEDNTHCVNDVIQFIDTTTGKTVLEIGTENTDDYYPYCIMRWYPENLAVNNR